MADSDCLAVCALDLVGIEPFGKPRHRATTQVAFHVSDAALAKIDGDGPVSAVFFLAI